MCRKEARQEGLWRSPSPRDACSRLSSDLRFPSAGVGSEQRSNFESRSTTPGAPSPMRFAMASSFGPLSARSLNLPSVVSTYSISSSSVHTSSSRAKAAAAAGRPGVAWQLLQGPSGRAPGLAASGYRAPSQEVEGRPSRVEGQEGEGQRKGRSRWGEAQREHTQWKWKHSLNRAKRSWAFGVVSVW